MAKKTDPDLTSSSKASKTDTGYDQRDVAIQTVIETKFYVSPKIASHHQLEQNEFAKIFYYPRTITTMMLTLFIINVLAYHIVPLHDAKEINADSPLGGFKYTSKIGILAGVFVFMAFSSAHYPDTLIKRPHPIFWRALLGILSLYLMFMVYILFQPLTEGRRVFKFFDQTLGEPLPEKGYADDCRIYTPENPDSTFYNIYDAVFDVHFIAHLFGWWFKMMIIRDVKVCWICSVIFEILEITFRHWLPNFWECWWDHLLLDLFGCNAVGIALGAYTCRYLYVGRMSWLYSKPSAQLKPRSSLSSFAEKFRPNVWARHEWFFFSSLWRYLGVLFYCFFVLSVDCNNFFLKFILWIPPDHKLLQVRLAIWAFSAIAATKEYYEYLSNKYCYRIGPFIWLTSLTLLVEFSIIIKFGQTMFHAPFPWYVQLIWVVIAVMVAVGGCYAYYNGRQSNSQAKSREFNPYDPSIEVYPHPRKDKKNN